MFSNLVSCFAKRFLITQYFNNEQNLQRKLYPVHVPNLIGLRTNNKNENIEHESFQMCIEIPFMCQMDFLTSGMYGNTDMKS